MDANTVQELNNVGLALLVSCCAPFLVALVAAIADYLSTGDDK